MGNKDRAVDFLKKLIGFVIKITENSYIESLSDMETKYESEKKEMQISELEKERKLYTLIVAVSVVTVLLVLCLLYFRQRLNKQKIKQLEQEKQLTASQAVIDGETAERTRLARDLHDGLGGMLSVVKLNLKDMKGYSLIENTDVANFNRAVEMLDKSIVELRRVSHHIMPDLSSGLKIPLEDFCRSIPEANFRFFGDDTHLDNRLKITVYRCVHELINNAIKHARTTAINVQLMIEGNLISLSVQDDGVGFAPDKVVKGLGLENIRARVAVYNGKVNIYSSPEKGGTEVSIEIELT
jgi:signal transduction histidine kinase